jgi:IS605 OrfB family transposase
MQTFFEGRIRTMLERLPALIGDSARQIVHKALCCLLEGMLCTEAVRAAAKSLWAELVEGGAVASDRQMGEKRLDLRFAHVGGMALLMKEERALEPTDIGGVINLKQCAGRRCRHQDACHLFRWNLLRKSKSVGCENQAAAPMAAQAFSSCQRWQEPVKGANEGRQGLHLQVANVRRDAHNKAARAIPDKRPSVLVIEELNVKGMVKNRRRARVLSDAALGQFGRILTYMAEEAGVTVVDRSFRCVRLQ